jgi:hypothetical protein
MDYALEATFYRTALLLGLIQPSAVHRWADQVIAREAQPLPAFFAVASVPLTDLSELRHALWPLVIEPDPPAVIRDLLGVLHAELTSGHRSLADTLTVLRQMRSMVRLPPEIYSDLNATLVAHAAESGPKSAIATWLRQFDQPGTRTKAASKRGP